MTVYQGFISYSHKDEKVSKRLHKALETYRIPKRLQGKPGRGTPTGKRLGKFFRDREELPTSADLGEQIEQALAESAYLIVICSRAAAQSRWVNQEILHFKRLGREDRILAVIVDGEPNASDTPGKEKEECFSPALRFAMGPDGELTGERKEPIAADMRRHGDGFENTKLKLIAGMLGVGFDDLVRRQQKRQQRIVTASLSLAVVMSITAGFAVLNYYRAEEETRRANEFLGQVRETLIFMNFDLRDLLEDYVPTRERMRILEEINHLVDSLGRNDGVSSEEQWVIAVAKAQEADVLLQGGFAEAERALVLYQEANAILMSSVQIDPSGIGRQYNLSTSLNRIGDINLRLGRTNVAIDAYQRSMDIREDLARRAPELTILQRGMSTALNNIGQAYLRDGRTDAALETFEHSLEISEGLARRFPDHRQFQLDMSVCLDRIADVHNHLGRIEVALNTYSRGLSIRENLARDDPNNVGYQRAISTSLNNIGQVHYQLGHTDAAVESFERGLEISEDLVRRDTDNSQYQRDITVAQMNLGLVHFNRDQLDRALAAYERGMQINETLLRRDPDNVQFQRDSTIFLDGIGEIEFRLNRGEVALEVYEHALDIRENIARNDPDNAQSHRDLASSHMKIGGTLYALGNRDSAWPHFREAYQIFQSLNEQGTLLPDDLQSLEVLERLLTENGEHAAEGEGEGR